MTFESSNGGHGPHGTNIDNNTTNDESQRQGTISSARFNLLSSMVGGGSLSLPLAFHQTGNMFVAPLLLIATGVIAQQSIMFLIKAGIYSGGSCDSGEHNNRNRTVDNRKGTASYENVAMHAFGPSARKSFFDLMNILMCQSSILLTYCNVNFLI